MKQWKDFLILSFAYLQGTDFLLGAKELTSVVMREGFLSGQVLGHR